MGNNGVLKRGNKGIKPFEIVSGLFCEAQKHFFQGVWCPSYGREKGRGVSRCLDVVSVNWCDASKLFTQPKREEAKDSREADRIMQLKSDGDLFAGLAPKDVWAGDLPLGIRAEHHSSCDYRINSCSG